MHYWLMKSEPDVYSIEDLKQETRCIWDGVRNYQARNIMRDMAIDDLAFFYHSNTKPPGIVGLMKIVQTKVVDPTQFDTKSKYYDAKSTPEQPRWDTVGVAFVEHFEIDCPLEQLKQMFKPDDLWVVRRGNRLSVMPVPDTSAEKILDYVKSHAS